MPRWHVKIDDEEFGPFRVEALHQWKHSGQLGPDTPIRKEHETTWQRLADTALPDRPPLPDHAVQLPPGSPKPLPAGGDIPPGLPKRKMLLDAWPVGTTGKTPIVSILREAIARFVRNGRLMILAGLLLWLLGSVPSYVSKLLYHLNVESPPDYASLEQWLPMIGSLTVGALLTLGGIALSLRLVTGQPARLAELFRPFRSVADLLGIAVASVSIAICAGILIFFGVAGMFLHPLWGVLILPGLYLFVRYSQVPYLATWRSDLGVGQTLKQSSYLIKGHRLRFLLLSTLLILPWLAAMAALWWAKGGGKVGNAFQGWEAYGVNFIFALISTPVALLAGAIFHRDINPPPPAPQNTQDLSRP